MFCFFFLATFAFFSFFRALFALQRKDNTNKHTHTHMIAGSAVGDGEIEQHGHSDAGDTTMEVVGQGCQDLSSYAYYAGGAASEDYSFEFSVDYECTTVTFTFVDVDDASIYSSWGFGGDYTLPGGNAMNGYSIIIEPDNNVWESTLEASADPEAQSSQDLTCEQTSSDGVRTTTCTRDFVCY